MNEPLTEKELLSFTRDIRQNYAGYLIQAGLAVTPVGGKAPYILGDEFIAEFNRDVTIEQIENLNNTYGVEMIKKNPYRSNQFLLRTTAKSDSNAMTLANQYHENPLTEYAHPNFVRVIQICFIPDDPLFGNQWHHRNTGQGGGSTDADIDSELAWDLTTGDPGVIIAVIDIGFDWQHPDLAPNRWINTGEIPGNGIDDDENGFIDDVNGGWNFLYDNNDPSGDHHGTAVAGVAGARGHNGLGVSGSCPNGTLMFLYLGVSDYDQALPFDYARENGADIITNSWHYFLGDPVPPVVSAAITTATEENIVVLFAAGNTDLDICSPGENQNALAARPDVMAVSSSTNQDRKVVNAAIGNCINILAPSHRGDSETDPFTGTLCVTTTDITGEAGYNDAHPPSAETSDLTETTDRDYTNFFGGTSSAAPLAAGVAGLILSANPALTRVEVQRLIQDTADKIEPGVAAYADNTGFSTPAPRIATHSYGRLNAFEAVRIAAPADAGGKGGVDLFMRDNHLDWGNTGQPSYTLLKPLTVILPGGRVWTSRLTRRLTSCRLRQRPLMLLPMNLPVLCQGM